MEVNWRDLHGKVIKEFLSYINEQTESFILKGGTALAQCYNLNRFSEDIYLDSQKENIMHHIQAFCKLNHYDYRIAKDTVTVKRTFILMWQKTPCLYRREMNATSAEFTQVIEVDNRT